MAEKSAKKRPFPGKVLMLAMTAALMALPAGGVFSAPLQPRAELSRQTEPAQSFTGKFRDHRETFWIIACALLLQSAAITLLIKSIAGRKKAEWELREQRNDLERMNRSLEQRIADEVTKSRERDRLLMQQSRFIAMGEMIGNIAHQWRQPLNMLGMVIQQMQMEHEKGELSAELMEGRVAKGMELLLQLSRTIDDFRNFFQPGIEARPFSLAKALARTVNFFGPSCSEHGIEITVRGSCALMHTGHVNEFSQALLNILNNARDALQEKESPHPAIVVTLVADGPRCVITVRDNAGGIAPEVIEKIFDPYFTTKEEGKGTGVGLYMTRTIIERQMQGSISVRNLPDGAEFRIIV